MIQLTSQETCTGCASCANICPKSAIKMHMDKEGFLFPFVNENLCVECGKCMKVCPMLNVRDTRNFYEPESYALWSHLDRKYSSSGGAFSALARMILNQGGVVYGVELDKSFTCKHTYIQDIVDLHRLRGSKYIQSEIGTAFETCLFHLKQRKNVLFTGTPCQVAGLYSFLGKKYDNLLTVDLVCHGVPSNMIFSAYIKKLKNEISREVKNFRFRKLDGWGYAPSIEFPESMKGLYGVNNLYMEAFHKSAIFRNACYKCEFAKLPRVGDCTIADFWGIGRHGIPFKHDITQGVSLILVNNETGKKALMNLDNIFIEKRELSEALIENNNIVSPSMKPWYRDGIIKDFLDPDLSLMEIDKKYHIVDWSIKNIIKTLTMQLHLFDIAKYLYNKMKSI